MNKCSWCLVEKVPEDFSLKHKKLTKVCKTCRNARAREHYKKTDYRREHAAENVKRCKKRRRKEISDLKERKPCEDCGGVFPAPCMDYHHKDSEEKSFGISYAISKGFSRERIAAEIEKCVLICANCHRIRHHVRAHSSTD